MHDIQVELSVKKLSDLTIKEIEDIYNKKRNIITTQEKEKYKAWANDGFEYILSDLALKVIMDCRAPTELGFNRYDITLTKEQSVLRSLMDAFERENMQTQYSDLSYKIDLYFHKYKLAIEVDEKGHEDRNIDHEIKRQELRWCHARDLCRSQIPATTGRSELRISCIQIRYLIH